MAATNEAPDRPRLAETILLIVVAAMTYHELRDPSRVLAWIFGGLPARSATDAQFQPWLGLLRGLENIFLIAVVVTTVTRLRAAEWIRRAATAYFILILAIVPMLAQVEIRLHVDDTPGNEAPYRSASHDGGVLQTEMASAELLAGRDPYAAHYGRAPMSRSRDSDETGWRSLGYDHNPAFDHLPYLPGVLYVSAPIQWLAQHIFHAYDQRFVYLIAALLLAYVLGTFAPPGPYRRMIWLFTLTNPLLRTYLMIGRNDVLLLLPLALFGRALLASRWRRAAIWLGVALAVKQFAIFALPFFALLVYQQRERDVRATLRDLWPSLAIPAIAVLPFLVWDARSFVADVLVWNLGGGAHPYPVRWDGYGLTPLLYAFGLIGSPAGANPWGWIAAPAMLVTLIALLAWMRARATPSVALIASGILLYVALATSRFFADNYLAVPALCLMLPLVHALGYKAACASSLSSA